MAISEESAPEEPKEAEGASDEAEPREKATISGPSAKPEAPPSKLSVLAARLRALDILPSPGPTVPLRRALPKGPLEWISATLLCLVLWLFVRRWMHGNDELLFDPLYANDDSRTAHFAFHRYGPEHALADDPIANEMIGFWMPPLKLAYRVLVPIVGIFWAPKVMQAVALSILFAAGWVLLRARRAGLACAALLVFLVLRDPTMTNRLAGGFGRAFVFPCFSLWLAGAIAQSERTRFASVVIAALTQNYAAAILLGAEGIHSLASAFGKSRALLVRRAKHYGALVLVTVALVGGALAAQGQGDRVHTLAEVKSTQLFKGRHRGEFPIVDPAPHMGKRIVSPFAAGGNPIPGALQMSRLYADAETAYPVAIVALLLLLGSMRIAPKARPALAFLGSTALLFWLARILAYRLYAPERYSAYGAPMVGVALGVVGIGLLAPRLAKRAVIRNFAAAACIALLTAAAGDGVVRLNGMTLSRRSQAALFDYAKGLPKESRIACHPWDCDDIPWWSGRATTGGYETMQMWMVGASHRVEERTQDALAALYATNRKAVFDYAAKYHVTHFLLRKDRYEGEDLAKKASLIDPFTAFANKLIGGKPASAFVFHKIPDSAIVHRSGGFVLVDVAKLEKAWASEPAAN